MPEFKLLVFLDPVEGEDEEFNDWYDNFHIPETLKGAACFKAAQRFRTVGEFLGSVPPAKYLAIYELEAESLEAAMQEIADINGVLRPQASEAVDLTSVGGPWPLIPMGPQIRADD